MSLELSVPASVVVADTGPLRYLILWEAVWVLPRLFGRVLVPPTVLAELSHPNTPPTVREWVRNPPDWFVRDEASAPLPPGLTHLDAGENAAIALLLARNGEILLTDDKAARLAMTRLQRRAVGTLGIIEAAAWRGLLNFEETLIRLKETNLYVTPALVDSIRERLEREQSRRPDEGFAGSGT